MKKPKINPATDTTTPKLVLPRTGPGRPYVNPLEYDHPYETMAEFAKLLNLRYDSNRTRADCDPSATSVIDSAAPPAASPLRGSASLRPKRLRPSAFLSSGRKSHPGADRFPIRESSPDRTGPAPGDTS